jgi:ribosomal protein S3AE
VQREIGKTLVNRTAGTKIASDGLKGRVFEISLADLEKDADDKAFRKIRLISEDVQGRNVLLNFHGMDFTTDKLRSLVKKWHSLIEAITDVKTSDGYTLRLFVLAFTKKAAHSIKKTAYAQTAQIRAIRARMVEIINREVTSSDLKAVVGKLKSESIGQDIEKSASVCSLCLVVLSYCARPSTPCRTSSSARSRSSRSPSSTVCHSSALPLPILTVSRLLEIHSDSAVAEPGTSVDRAEGFVEPAPLASV